VAVIAVGFAVPSGPDELSAMLLAGGLVAARLVPVLAIAPFFGGRLVPAPVRVAVALAFAALLLPSAGAGAAAALAAGEVGPIMLGALLVKEVLVGAALGLLAALPFHAADAAGRLADAARGASMSQLLVPQTGETSTPLGDLGLQLSVLLFLALDGHLVFFRALAASYEALPVVAMPGAAGWQALGEASMRAAARLIAVAAGLAAPVLAAMFLTDLALGLINRVSPQVGVYFVGMPAKAVLGLLALLIAVSATASALTGESIGAMRALERAVEGLAP
jgi:type III secretion protein SpaR/YscT/HrcT